MKAQRLGQGGAEWTSAVDQEQFQNYTKYTWVDKYGMQGIYHVHRERRIQKRAPCKFTILQTFQM